MNIKQIGIFALIAVVVLVGSVLIAFGHDSNVADDAQGSVDAATKTYEEKIAELNKIINDLKNDLANAENDSNKADKALEDAIAELDKLGIKLESWNAATLVVPEKLEALNKAYKTWNDTYEKDGLTLSDWYDEENTEELVEHAMYAIVRATSVEDMDAIIAGFTADLAKLPTKIDNLKNMIENLKKDDLTIDDINKVIEAEDYLNEINPDIFKEGELDGFKQEIADLYASLRGIIADAFVAKVNAIPTLPLLTDKAEDKDAINDATAIYDLIVSGRVFTEDEILAFWETEANANAVNTLYAAISRLSYIDLIVADATRVNTILDSQNNTEWKATVACGNKIVELQTTVNTWIEQWSIVTDKEDAENYNDYLYNLVKHNVLAGYVDAYNAAIAPLAEKANAYIAAVNAAKTAGITCDSKNIIDDLLKLYFDSFGTQGPEDIDAILAVTKRENSVVDAWSTFNDLRKESETKAAAHKEIADLVTTIEQKIKQVYYVTCNGGHADGVDCDCKAELHADAQTKEWYAEVDAMIVRVLTHGCFDETSFNAELLAQYKVARLHYVISDVKANVQTAWDESTKENRDEAKKSLLELINMSLENAGDYAFVVESGALKDTWSASIHLDDYTLEGCKQYFASFVSKTEK